MTELTTKEGALTETELAAYGIPPKQPEGLEGQGEEPGKGVANDHEAEVSGEVVEKSGKG